MKQLFVAIALPLALFAATSHAETELERGRYLVETLAACGNCHTPKGPNGPVPSKKFAGGDVIKHADFTAVTPNITPDPETGIGRWTDHQIFRAIREGRRPDGSLLGPAMPSRSYRNLADEDVKAMIAYLRSVPPVYNLITAKSRYDHPLPPNWGPPVGRIEVPAKDDIVAYGAYVAGPLARCMDCHTERKPGEAIKFGAGGKEFHGPWGISVSADLTPSGLGEWSEAEIEQAIRSGVARDGHKLFPPMPFGAYRNMAADDMAALIAYLRSLPTIE
jgi:mono/diheme cytochrome c family protein